MDQKRQTARKVRIKEIVEGQYVKEEGWTPNYVKLENGITVSRINLVGTVLLKSEEQNHKVIIVDDGTGKISLRVFNEVANFEDIQIGDPVRVIGKPREYGNEMYIVPEILKRLKDKRWIKVRQLELKTPIKKEVKKPEPVSIDPSENIFKMIRNLDKGEGADTEEILAKISGAENVIKTLLEEGEIFELKPGKIKILE